MDSFHDHQIVFPSRVFFARGLVQRWQVEAPHFTVGGSDNRSEFLIKLVSNTWINTESLTDNSTKRHSRTLCVSLRRLTNCDEKWLKIKILYNQVIILCRFVDYNKREESVSLSFINGLEAQRAHSYGNRISQIFHTEVLKCSFAENYMNFRTFLSYIKTSFSHCSSFDNQII